MTDDILPNLRLLQGNVLGLLVGSQHHHGLNMPEIPTDIEPEIDANGDYTGRIFITRQSGVYVLTVEPYNDK